MSIQEEGKKINPEPEYEEISLSEVAKHYPPSKQGETQGKDRAFWTQNKRDLLTLLIIMLVGTGSFGLGRISKIEAEKTPVTIVDPEAPVVSSGAPNILPIKETPKTSPVQNVAAAASAVKSPQAGALVGAKTGTKYYYPWCGSVSRIKEENKVWFASVEEARKAGYTPAANCKGLK